MKFLILEDDDVDFSFVNRLLKHREMSFDSEVCRVSTLDEACKILKEDHSFDLIISDLGLPDCSGSEAIQVLKEMAPETPTVVLTGSHKIQDLQILSLGADDFLAKDCLNLNNLKRMVQYSIERAKTLKKYALEKKKAEAASLARSSFLANMSHEIRTPLNLMVGTADLLKETNTSPVQGKYIETFIQASNHLLGVINDVLDFSKIDSEEIQLSESLFSFENLMEEVSDIISTSFRNKKLLYDYDVQETGDFWGDSKRLKQIILNCLNNSFKFTDSGWVKVIVSSETLNNEKLIHISISDSGKGIPKKELALIFKKFHQVESSSTKICTGTGLGLTIVKRLVEAMKGSVSVSSQVGRGTQVNIKIPLKLQSRSDTSYSPSLILTHGRVLLYSEKELESQRIQRFIKSKGYQVNIVSHKESLLSILENSQNSFQKILVDVVNSSGGGVELLQSIKHHGLESRCIVLVPMVHRSDDIPLMEELSFKNILLSPVSRSGLEQALQKSEDQVAGTASETSFETKAQDLSRLRILIVDDDLENRELIGAFLDPTGCQFSFAESGAQALLALKTCRYDLVLMDIQMPEMDGFTTVKKVRDEEQKEGGAPSSIFALSANAFSNDVERAKEAGFSGYISKPIRKKVLLKAILQSQQTKKFLTFDSF